MTLTRAFVVYLVLLHLVAAVAAGWLLWAEHRPWILAVEAGLVISLAITWFFLRAGQMPREMAAIGSEWLKEGDLAHSFRRTGVAEIDRLTGLYNELVTRLRAERARQEEQDVFLHKVLAASPSGMVTTDHDGRVDEVNPAAALLLEVAPQELRGRRPGEVSAPLVGQLAEVPVGQSRLLRHRGRRRLRCTHSHFFDRGSRRSFFVVEDLTHELWESERLAYQTLIRTLSHEVNNTLGATSSILHSGLAYRDQLRPEDRDDFTGALRVAIERSEHLGAFMQRYAEVVRLPPPARVPADLGAVLDRIVRLLAPECEQREIAVTLDLEPDLPPLVLDVIQIEQVFVNVLRNALEAIDRRGTIAIRVRRRDGRTRVTIRDSGPGLSAEAQAHLFTPFFSTKPQGQGVGLTLVREILTRHGCDFALESPPGGPTRFVIVFE